MVIISEGAIDVLVNDNRAILGIFLVKILKYLTIII